MHQLLFRCTGRAMLLGTAQRFSCAPPKHAEARLTLGSDALAVVGVGDGDHLTALAAVVLSSVDSYDVGRVAVDISAGTGVTTLG